MTESVPIRTAKVSKSTTTRQRIVSLLKAKQSSLAPSYIQKELDIPIGTIYRNLQRMKDDGILEKDGHSLWKLSNSIDNISRQHSKPIRTLNTWGGPKVSQLDETLVAFLLRYDSWHGLEAHLPEIDSNMEFEDKVNGLFITLEKRKFRVKSSHFPVKFEDTAKVLGMLERILQSDLNYNGPAWLNHIELNKDHEGYKLDGLQRVEVKTVLGSIYRFYNKKIGNRPMLRSESITHIPSSKEIPLEGALYVLSLANNAEDVHTIVNKQIQQLKYASGEMRYATNSVRDVDLTLTNGLATIQTKLEDSIDVNTDIQYDVLKELKTHTKQNDELIAQSMGIETQFNELNEKVRELMVELKDWKEYSRKDRIEILKELKDIQNKSFPEIADILNANSRQAVQQFYMRNVDTKTKGEGSKNENKEGVLIGTFKNIGNSKNIDTILNEEGLSIDNSTISTVNVLTLVNEFGITRNDSQDSIVLKILKKLGKVTSRQIIELIENPRFDKVAIRRSLSRLSEKEEISSRWSKDRKYKIYLFKKKGDEK